MSLSLKAGVRLHGLTSAMVIAVMVIKDVFAEEGFDCVMTAGIDGKHVSGSCHYYGGAGDFRINHVPVDKHPIILKKCQDRLGADYFVQLEVDHLHAQWKPQATYGV